MGMLDSRVLRKTYGPNREWAINRRMKKTA